MGLLFLLLNNSSVQTALVQHFVKDIEQKTGSKVSVGKIHFSYWGNFSFEDILISDTQQDTLIYAKNIKAKISGINLSSSNFRLKRLELEDPYLKIISYNSEDMNLFTFLDAIEGKTQQDTTKLASSYFFSVNSISIKNGRFVYYESGSKAIPYGMNYEDMDFHQINAEINNLRTVGDAIKMHFKSLQCKEKSGFEITTGTTDLTIDSGFLGLDDVHIKSPKSELNAEKLNFSYTPETKAWANFTKAVIIDYLLKDCKLNLEEISLFNENLRGYNLDLTASGHIKGTVQNMRCEDVDISTFKNTRFLGNISINGLPNIDETFFDSNIRNFQTSLDDLEKIKLPNYEEGYLSFPQTVKQLGVFDYKGKYTGFVSDFVFYGQFFSKYGNIKTDISVKPSTRTKQLELSGKIVTTDFNIGDLLNNKMVGKVALNVNVLNAMANENYNSFAKIKGTVNKLEIRDYPYENIKLDGYFANKIFDGKLSMNDDNIAFDFSGSVDLHQEVPKTNFTLDINQAKLSPLNLNILSKDSLARISFTIKSQLNGGSIDDATGFVNFYDLKYFNSKGNFKTDSITLKSSLKKGLRSLDLTSDFLNVNFNGNFKVSELSNLPQRLASQYINVGYFKIADTLRSERGKLTVNFTNMNPLLDLFTDGYRLSKNAKLAAHYDIGNNDISLQFDAGVLKIKNYILHKINWISEGNDKLQTKLSVDRIQLTDDINLRWLSMENTVSNNAMNTELSWGKKEIFNYNGSLSLNTVFRETANQQIAIDNKLSPSSLLFDGKDWKVHNAQILIDSTDISINNLKISNKNENEYLKIDGLWSSTKDHQLKLDLNEFEIGHFWNTLNPKNIKLSGKVSGYAKYKVANSSYTLVSDLQLPNLIVENQNLGAIGIHSDWDREKNVLNTKASLLNNDKELFILKGYYGLSNNSLNYTADFNGFDLQLIKGFAKEYLTNIDGNIDGNLEIKGKANKPKIGGSLNFDIPKITVAETGVTYHLKEKLNIKDSRIIFDNFKISDKKNNAATINGEVLADMGKDANINLKIQAKHLRVLEDSYQPLAYGNTHVSANLQATGNFDHVKVKGNVVTDNNSKIIVPFDSATEVGDNDFITFINPADSAKYEEYSDILFIPTGSKSPVSFNIDFSINPTSEIQVFFESKSGSTLKSRGTADLLIKQNQLGKQTIIGEYTVSQGSFFYSLQSIVNKKFNLQEGGTIRWNGAPEKAYVNLRAVYQLKASVAPLLFQNAENSKLNQTTVLCKTHITGQLEDPKLTFEIEFPNLDNTTEGRVKAALQTTDLTKQVLSLLVFNRFTTPEYNPNVAGANNGDALSVTTSELLSSQISNILSRLSEDVNVGFIYRPGDNLTKEELGLAISTELLQNRVVISGNLGFSSQDESNRFNDFIGDVDFDIKLNKKGNLRLRAFSHAQDNLYYYENKRNIQGAGIIYNEEFDTFRELIEHYKEKLGWGKKKDKK